MIFVSYNIQWGTGKDGRVDLARIAGEIGAADVIALQEVDRFWTRSRMTDQAAEFAALLAGPDGLIDAWRALGHAEGPGWTCHEADGGWRIDYALVTPDLKDHLRAISVDHAAQGSDHQPIRVEIEL